MSSIVIQGDTSGSITVEAPSVAGTHTLTLPKATGNIATDATVGLGTKNLIINGDMKIAQRGTSTTGITGNGYHTVDRWYSEITTAGTWTQTQDTDVPLGQGFATSLKMQCTTADASLGAGDLVNVTQRIEGQNLQHLKKGTANAESLTLSFWVKSNKTGTYIIELDDNDNGRNINQSYTINSADTWEKKILTFSGDTTGALDNDNNHSFRVYFWLAAGSVFSSGTLQTSWGSTVNANRVVGNVNLADSTSNYINITAVQLEVGENATPFEHRPYDMELAKCQRYYIKFVSDGTIHEGYFGMGYYNSTVNLYCTVSLPVPMRESPILSYSALSDLDLEPFDVAPSSVTYVACDGNFAQVQVYAVDPAARTKGFAGQLKADVTNGYIDLDAEL